MKILILGGINEALWLAQQLTDTPHQVIYSLAGKGEIADLETEMRVGGFGGVEGLSDYLKEQQIELLIDATHPYAETMSLHAWQASDQSGVELWAYQRPPWQQEQDDHWIQTPHWFDAIVHSGFQRPFITLGSSIVDSLADIPVDQHWLVRALPGKLPPGQRYTLIEQRGPFSLEDELALFKEHKIDALVCKNSGGPAVSAKIEAARQQQLPVIMLSRPQLPEPKRLFLKIELLLEALL